MKLNLKVIFLSFCNLVILNSMIGSNLAIRLSPAYAYFIPLIIGGISVILLIFIPKINNDSISKILKGKIFRFIIVIYLFLSTIFILYTAFKLLAFKLYFITPIYLLIIVSLFFIFLLGKLNLKTIISVNTLIYILIIGSTFLMFADTNKNDFRLLLPFKFYLNSPLRLLALIGIFLDSILYLFVPLTNNQTISKWNFVIGNILGSLLSSWFIIYSYTSLNYQFFIDLPFPALYRYRIYAGPRYLEHLDVFFDFFVCSYFILKATFNLELFRIYFKAKNNFFFRLGTIVLIGIAVLFAFYHTSNEHIYMFYPMIVLSSLMIIIYFGLWRYRNHERNSSSN